MKFELSRLLSSDIAKLTVGTIGARLIAILFIPIISRLYSPTDFGILASFIAIVSVVSVAACLRFDVSIPFAKEEDAQSLFVLSIITATAVTVVAFLIVTFLSEFILNFGPLERIGSFIWLVPVAILTTGLYSTFQNWATRTHQFTQIAYSRVQQSLLGSISQVFLGWIGAIPIGLLIGFIISSSASFIRLYKNSPINQFWRILCLPKELYPVLKRYKRYPIFSTPESIINIAGVQIPILIIAGFSGSDAGYLFLAMQIVNTPMSLLGMAVSQVYSARIKGEIEFGRMDAYTLELISKLMLFGLPPILAISLFSPAIVPYIFGNEWGRSGYMVAIMAPWNYLQFIISPVSTVLHATGMQKEMLAMTVIGLVQRVGVVIISIEWNLALPVEAFIVGSVMYYMTVFGFVVFSAKISISKLRGLALIFLNKWLLLSYISCYLLAKMIY